MTNLITRKSKEKMASDLRALLWQANTPSASHTHTPGTLTVSTSNDAASPHTHALTTSSNPGAAASILASDSNGEITLQGITIDNLDIDGNTIQSTSGEIILDKGTDSVTVYRSTNSGTPAAAADDFVIESGDATTNIGMSILVGTSSLGQLVFGNASDTNAAYLRYSSADDTLQLATAASGGTIRFLTDNAVEAVRIDANGNFMIGDTTPSASGPSIVINQGTSDDEVFQVRSEDVAHGMTSVATTDTYGTMKKIGGAVGGLEFHGLSESGGSQSIALSLVGSFGGAADTTKSASGEGIVHIDSRIKSGTSVTSVAASGNLFSIANNGSTTLILDEDDLYLDGTSNQNNWDDHDDIALLLAAREAIAPAGKRFSSFISDQQNQEVLERTGVVKYNADGRHFVAMKALQMLKIDAIRQLNERIQSLETIIHNAGLEL